MRQLSTFRVTLLSLVLGLAAAFLLYSHAWRIPVIQNLRDTRLFLALWIVATPLAAVLTAAVRLARWRSAFISGAVWVGLSAPLYGLGSGFEKVQRSSQDKAVLCNLRQLAAAADQYFLEHGATVVRYEELVGPGNYLKSLRVVAGEDYLANFPYRAGGILSAEYPSGRIINYAAGDTPPDYRHTFEASDPRPSWRAGKLAAPASKPVTTSPAPALGGEILGREPARPAHKIHRGSMCASCHAKKR